MTAHATTLRDLPEGASATITHTEGVDASLLRAMGLREGVQVTVRQAGEPVIVEAGLARLGVASSVSAAVCVTPTG